MLINKYSLLGNSYGEGYKDDPYIMDGLYVRGDSSVTWEVIGSGRFGINLSDMTIQLFEKGIYNTIISVFVNGELVKVANSPDETVSDFGVLLDLDDDTSHIQLIFNGSDNSLLYIDKISSFLYEEAPVQPPTLATTTPEPTEGQEGDPIRDNGIRILNIDLEESCGPYRLRVLPDTGEFHVTEDKEVWFTGNTVTEREYNVKVEAFNDNGVISSRDLSFSILDCNSSGECTGEGGGGEVDDDMNTIGSISVSIEQCGSIDGEEGVFAIVSITWTGDQSKTSDIQISSGNSFNILHSEYSSLSQKFIRVVLPVNETFFVRGRQRDGSSVSRWSSSIQFTTSTQSLDCTGVLPPIDPPETIPLPCLAPPVDPPGPNNPDGPDRPDPEDPRNPRDPSPGPGPIPCRGNGCGGGGGGGGSNPNPRPGRPCCYTPPGCIGPGCGPDSAPPDGPGGPPGGPGGPGGPNDPNPPEEFPPETPSFPVPTCDDGRLHSTILQVKNHADPGTNEGVEVNIKWDKERNASCQDYFARVQVEDWTKIVPSVIVGANDEVTIDLGAACPECINICVTSTTDTEVTWKLLTVAYDDNGNPTQPYALDQATESTKPICDCTNYSIWDMVKTYNVSLGNQHTERFLLNGFSGAGSSNYAMLRNLEPNEQCVKFQHVAFNAPTANGVASHQTRTKLACFACTDRGFKEVTSEIIGCEVMSTTSHGDTSGTVPQSRHVSVQDHWKMGVNTQSYAKNEWPKNGEFGDWHHDVSPYRSSWDLEVPLCVACCKYTDWGTPPWTGKTRRVHGGNRGVSTNTQNVFNNIDCNIGDPEVAVSQNWGGHGSGTGEFRPCAASLWSWEILDSYGIANFKWKFKQLGYNDITLAEADAVTANLGQNGMSNTCESYTQVENICTLPHFGNYSYLLEIDNRTKVCNLVPDDPFDRNQMYYVFGPNSSEPNGSILYNGWVNNTTPCEDTHHYNEGITVSCIKNSFGAYTVPGTSDCVNQTPPWPLDGADGLPISKDRYTFKYFGEPFLLGRGAGSNPLP